MSIINKQLYKLENLFKCDLGIAKKIPLAKNAFEFMYWDRTTVLKQVVPAGTSLHVPHPTGNYILMDSKHKWQ